MTNYMNECRKFILDRVMPEDLQRLPEPDPEDIKTMLDIALNMARVRGFVVKFPGDPEGCVGFQVGDFTVVPRATEVEPKSVWDDASLSNSPEGCEVYALLRSDGVLVPPIDNDCIGFLAWPTYIEALDGLSYQLRVRNIDPDTKIVKFENGFWNVVEGSGIRLHDSEVAMIFRMAREWAC